MDRRKFIRDSGFFSAGTVAAISAGGFVLDPGLSGAQSAPSQVAVAVGTDWASLVERALAPLGGIKAFVKTGAKVCVKPNASFDRAPEQASNTHPEIVKSVVKLCLEAGASEVKVFDRTLAEPRRCFANSGIGAAVESFKDKKAAVVYSEDRDYSVVRLIKGKHLKEWSFSNHALHSDLYINLPVAKQHGATKLSMGLKNALGIAGGNRGRIHWNIDQGIADLNSVFKSQSKPVLTIIDATRILLRNGPSGGNLKDVAIKNTVIASTDTVAADAYVTKTLFNMEPSSIGHIVAAYNLGLGEIDLSKIKVLKS